MKEKSDRHIRIRVSQEEYGFVREVLRKKKSGGQLPKIEEIDSFVSEWLNDFPDGREETFNPITIEGKAAILSDIHLGIHDKQAITSALTYLKKERIDFLILNGDTLDSTEISTHPKNSKTPKYLHEVTLAKSLLSAIAIDFPHTKIYFKEGNHEDRLQRYIMANAEALDGIVDLPKILDLEAKGIGYVESLRYMIVNNIHVFHGHEIRVSGTNAARKLYDRTAHSSLMGHVHKIGHFVKKGTDGIYRDAFTTGCLCKLSQGYMMHSDSQHGFAIIERDGNVRNHEIRNGAILP
jgi:predicted phosphodiesterase